jgi:capsule polysaccharide export protein KpsE/RkpR
MNTKWFWKYYGITAILPIFLYFAYLFAIAPKLYVSTADLVVRKSASNESSLLSSGLGAMAGGGLSSGSSEELYLFKKILEGYGFFGKLYSEFGTVEFLTFDIFFGIKSSSSIDDCYFVYKRLINVSVDEKASVITVEFKSESPEMAEGSLSKILKLAKSQFEGVDDELMQLRLKSRKKLLESAEAEYLNELTDFVDFQIENKLAGEALLGGGVDSRFYELDSRIIQHKASLAEEMYAGGANVEKMSRTESLINELESVRSGLVDDSLATMAGSNDGDKGIADYRIAEAKMKITENKYQSAFVQFEEAHADLAGMSSQVVFISSPSHPEVISEPNIFKSLLKFGFVILLASSCGLLVVMAIRDHKV